VGALHGGAVWLSLTCETALHSASLVELRHYNWFVENHNQREPLPGIVPHKKQRYEGEGAIREKGVLRSDDSQNQGNEPRPSSSS
jgi:hypothetical protein